MIHDISPLIHPGFPVWPGDTPASREILLDMHRGDNITLSTFRGTVHLGAHADAPSHYGRDAETIDRRPLELYLGPCRVIRIDGARGRRIDRDDLKGPIEAERVLIRTGTYPDSSVFQEDFASLSPDLVHQLHREGVRLIGIDTPSVDPFEAKDLTAHQAFLDSDMAILEGLRLDEVPEGLYELIALPLKLEGFDASPVRAILRTIEP